MCKISVIIPIYNVEQYIKKNLESVLNQTLKDIEIILINDGSTDDSFEICKEIAKKDSRIKLFSKENGGQATARNLGLENAKGRYICFVDADDWIEDGYCKSLFELANVNQIDVGVCNYNCIKNGLISKSYTRIHQDRIESLNEHDFRSDLFLYNYIFKEAGGSPCNKIYSRNFLEGNKIKFYENRYAEDLVFNAICLQYCERIGYTNQSLYNYRTNIGSTTKIYRENYFDEFVELIKKYEQVLVDNNSYNKYYNNCSVLVYSGIMNSISNVYKFSDQHKCKIATLDKIINNEYAKVKIKILLNEKMFRNLHLSFKKQICNTLIFYLINKKSIYLLDKILSVIFKCM